jgi:lipid II:glycine glycyltransferase (peptidoglycan interpeptide bridge formation enzyme)
MTTKNTKDLPWQLRSASLEEINDWNNLVTNNPDGGNFLQTRAFAAIKLKEGWTPYYFIYEKESVVVAALALTRSIFHGNDLWYFPKGPGVPQKDFAAIVEITRRYAELHNPNIFLIQMEPEWCEEAPPLSILNIDMTRGIQAHASTVIVPLEPSINAIFDSLSKRARYGVRLGKRERVQIKSVAASEQNFHCMYALMKTVAGGKGVPGIRPYAYYRRFWQTHMASGMGRLYFAYEKGIPVVGAFAIVLGEKSFYKDGGSTPLRESKGASYLLQWKIIQDMKEAGAMSYDMLGTPPSNRRGDVTHRLHGVGLFKTAFSKEVIDYHGVFNIPFSKWKYNLWKKWIYPLLCRVMRLRNRYFY